MKVRMHEVDDVRRTDRYFERNCGSACPPLQDHFLGRPAGSFVMASDEPTDRIGRQGPERRFRRQYEGENGGRGRRNEIGGPIWYFPDRMWFIGGPYRYYVQSILCPFQRHVDN